MKAALSRMINMVSDFRKCRQFAVDESGGSKSIA